MKNLITSMVTVAQTTPVGTLFLIFAISATVCAIISFVGYKLENRFAFSRWEAVITFPFVMLGFATWFIAAISLVELLIACALHLF